MALEDLVTVNITAETRTPTQEGFGTLLIAGYHTKYVDRVRSYTGLSGLVADGFATTDPIYKAAAAAFSQNPRPPRIKVGRRTLAPSQSVRITPTIATEGFVYRITVSGTALTYTVLAAATTTTVATAIAALINALSTAVASSVAADITVTPQVANTLVSFEAWSKELLVQDLTADPGIATDLAAIALADSDWYGLALDSNSKAEVVAAAAWIEANGKLFIAQTGDSDVLDGGSTTDVLSTIKASTYGRTAGLLHLSIAAQWMAAGLAAQRFTAQAGSDTWAYKTIAAVSTHRSLTSTERTAALAKNATIYETNAGVNVTVGGKVAGGEWIDVVRGLDWLRARLRERVFGVLISSPKVPYTQAGIDTIGEAVKGVLDVAASPAVQLLADGTQSVLVPKVGNVTTTDKQNRTLSNVQWSARLAGAIHLADIAGTVTP